jgi:hypothetical protein
MIGLGLRGALLGWAAALWLGLGCLTVADAQSANAPGGLAAGGYDVVAYFTVGQAVRGDPNLAQVFEGMSYRFANAENRDRFFADPLRYLPAYGGHSAYGVASGRLVPADPQLFSIRDGRLFLEANQEMRSLWLRDPEPYIARADRLWPSLH